MNPLKYIWEKGIASAFLTGLFVLLPVILTLLIIEWIVSKLRAALGPGSVLGALMPADGDGGLPRAPRNGPERTEG